MYKIVLIRHGESEWNLENRFTGWTDVDLTEHGISEAHAAAKLLKDKGYSFDIAFTSLLRRANKTLYIILDELDLLWIPVEHNWRLNERHYGALQGLNKSETAKKFGEDQVHIWRRSYDVPPPALEDGDKRLESDNPRYSDLKPGEFPRSECLKDTVARVLPYWTEKIVPQIKAGKKIIVAAHGNSLRALVKYLDNISDDDIVDVDIPTGQPLVYELDENLMPITHYYLDDPEKIEAAKQAVLKQGKIIKG